MRRDPEPSLSLSLSLCLVLFVPLSLSLSIAVYVPASLRPCVPTKLPAALRVSQSDCLQCSSCCVYGPVVFATYLLLCSPCKLRQVLRNSTRGLFNFQGQHSLVVAALPSLTAQVDCRPSQLKRTLPDHGVQSSAVAAWGLRFETSIEASTTRFGLRSVEGLKGS